MREANISLKRCNFAVERLFKSSPVFGIKQLRSCMWTQWTPQPLSAFTLIELVGWRQAEWLSSPPAVSLPSSFLVGKDRKVTGKWLTGLESRKSGTFERRRRYVSCLNRFSYLYFFCWCWIVIVMPTRADSSVTETHALNKNNKRCHICFRFKHVSVTVYPLDFWLNGGVGPSTTGVSCLAFFPLLCLAVVPDANPSQAGCQDYHVRLWWMPLVCHGNVDAL